MKINWKVRFQNKGTLAALVLGAIALVYSVLDAFGITPPVKESGMVEIAGAVINALVLAGVVIDPTTEGINDSDEAMAYSCPRCYRNNDDDGESICAGHSGESETDDGTDEE